MQQLQIIGNIGQDATIKEHNGKKFVAFSVACSSSYKDGNGNKVEQTQWYDIICKAESLVPYLQKGKKVFIQGSQRVKMYQTGDGSWAYSISVSARDIQLCSPVEKKTESTADDAQKGDTSASDDDGDVPF